MTINYSNLITILKRLHNEIDLRLFIVAKLRFTNANNAHLVSIKILKVIFACREFIFLKATIPRKYKEIFINEACN